MAEKFNTRYFRGQGKVFIGEIGAGGAPENLQFLGDMTSVELTPDITRSTTIENVTGQNGVGNSYIQARQYNVSMAMRSVLPRHFRHAIQADLEEIAAGSVTGETHQGRQGGFIVLDHQNVSLVDVTAPTGMTEGTDYIVHAKEGMIEWLSADDEVTVSYDHGKQSVLTANPRTQRHFLVITGINNADDDRRVRAEIYRVRIDPAGVPAISDERQDFTVGGVVEIDTSRAEGDQFFRWRSDEDEAA